MTRADCAVPPGAVWTIVGAGALGLVATYWDDGWHTEIGRDSALIPPHLLLYVSVGLVGVVLAVWLLTTLWRTRSVRSVFATPGLALAVAAGVVTAGAAPADAAWHAAFGRDSVLWSPPHLLSVIGTAVLVVAVLLGAAASRPARTALAVLLLGAAEVVVLEYETDVPQFTEALYLPVLLAVALGVARVVRTLVADSVVVAWTVLGYLVFRLGIFVGFMIGGWVTPDVPIALLGLLLLEAPAKWGRARWPLAGLAIVVLQVVASATGISAVATGPTLVAAAIVAPVLAVVLIAVMNGRLVSGAVVLALFLAASWPAPPARAHDPGQGEELATARFTVSGDGAGGVSVRVDDVNDAQGREWAPGALVARRAGRVVVAPLAGRSAFDGAIDLPSSGLWFVYAELRAGGTTAEVWLPVRQNESGTFTARRSVYLPAGAGGRSLGEFLAGTALLVVGAGLTGWAGAAVRRRRSPGR
ncbi:hypothetical protein [Actinophytocola sp. NPDC049390]|uniref:hypothetical protein n=1 Tax=Actinophytocola sp. NPDC049390 TaxID=3363894 RepID=UPI0037931D81